jgi:hypothetical protein
VPVPTESYDSASTCQPTLKKRKMTLDHMLAIVQFLLKASYKQRSFNTSKNKKKSQNDEVDATLGYTQEFDLWHLFRTNIKGWIQSVHSSYSTGSRQLREVERGA